MKKNGIYHGEISKLIAELEHFDTILIGDAGMPCQPGVKLIDLAVCAGIPSFSDVLKTILYELEFSARLSALRWRKSARQRISGSSPTAAENFQPILSRTRS